MRAPCACGVAFRSKPMPSNAHDMDSGFVGHGDVLNSLGSFFHRHPNVLTRSVAVPTRPLGCGSASPPTRARRTPASPPSRAASSPEPASGSRRALGCLLFNINWCSKENWHVCDVPVLFLPFALSKSNLSVLLKYCWPFHDKIFVCAYPQSSYALTGCLLFSEEILFMELSVGFSSESDVCSCLVNILSLR